MKIKILTCVIGVVFATACSKQNDQQMSESPSDKGASDTLGGHSLGSATDIATNSVEREQNPLNQSDNGIGGPAQREAGNFETQPLPVDANDKELASAVRVALSTGSTGTTGVIAEDQLTKIQVTAKGGVVTLTGPVENEEEKKIIEKQVAGMKGVKSVVNQLQVAPGQRSDTPLQPLYPRTPGNQ
jgi:hypothetical protein